MNITTIVPLFLIFISAYLIWSIMQVKKPSQDKTAHKAEPKRKKGDIVGKSYYTPLEPVIKKIQSEEKENTVDDTKQTARIPDSELDQVFADTTNSEEMEIDLYFDDTPNDYDEDYYDEYDEEFYELNGIAKSSLAKCLTIEELVKTIETVDNNDRATSKQNEDAGQILFELKDTDMIENIVSGKPERRDIVSTLLDKTLSAYFEKHKDQNTDNAKVIDVPEGVDIRDFIL